MIINFSCTNCYSAVVRDLCFYHFFLGGVRRRLCRGSSIPLRFLHSMSHGLERSCVDAIRSILVDGRRVLTRRTLSSVHSCCYKIATTKKGDEVKTQSRGKGRGVIALAGHERWPNAYAYATRSRWVFETVQERETPAAPSPDAGAEALLIIFSRRIQVYHTRAGKSSRLCGIVPQARDTSKYSYFEV